MAEISLPYGNTDVFFTVEADELLFSKGYNRPKVGDYSSDALFDILGPQRSIEIGIDAKLLLEDRLQNSVLRILEGLRERGFSVNSRILGPKGLRLSPGNEILDRLSLTYQGEGTEGERIDLILGFFTSFVFLDSLRLLGPVAFRQGGNELLESLRTYAEAGEIDALSSLMNSFDAGRNQLPSLVAFRLQDGEIKPHVLSGEKVFMQTMSSWMTESSLTLPVEANSLFGSLGGQPSDSIPSLGILYLIDVANRLDLEAMAFAAIWKHSATDIQFLLSGISQQREIESKLRGRFLWENVVLYMMSNMKTGKKVRVLTSMHPLLVERLLGWRGTSSASETVGSLRRALGSKLRLCSIGDLTCNRPLKPLESREGN